LFFKSNFVEDQSCPVHAERGRVVASEIDLKPPLYAS
jgi:hypothetical protein